MARKDITDEQVCRAYKAAWDRRDDFGSKEIKFADTILQQATGQPMKVCYAAMSRADDRGLIDYGVSLRSGWLTEKGLALLDRPPPVPEFKGDLMALVGTLEVRNPRPRIQRVELFADDNWQRPLNLSCNRLALAMETCHSATMAMQKAQERLREMLKPILKRIHRRCAKRKNAARARCGYKRRQK